VKLRRRAIVNARWWVVACLAAFLLPAAGAYAVSTNYFGPGPLNYGEQRETPGVAPRGWNKVYRNVYGCNPGSKFGLFYTDMTSVYNWCSNPFLDSRSDPNYVHAFCHDWDDRNGTSDPVTCVTTKP
jgi:hypothetical protein